MFLNLSEQFENEINSAAKPFEQAIKYAIIGNIIDFNPIHNSSIEDIMKWFKDADTLLLTVNHMEKLIGDIGSAKSLLYLGDNWLLFTPSLKSFCGKKYIFHYTKN